MTANFGLPSVGAENRDAYMKEQQYRENVKYCKVLAIALRLKGHRSWVLGHC